MCIGGGSGSMSNGPTCALVWSRLADVLSGDEARLTDGSGKSNERHLYPAVETWLKAWLQARFASVHLEIERGHDNRWACFHGI